MPPVLVPHASVLEHLARGKCLCARPPWSRRWHRLPLAPAPGPRRSSRARGPGTRRREPWLAEGLLARQLVSPPARGARRVTQRTRVWTLLGRPRPRRLHLTGGTRESTPVELRQKPHRPSAANTDGWRRIMSAAAAAVASADRVAPASVRRHAQEEEEGFFLRMVAGEAHPAHRPHATIWGASLGAPAASLHAAGRQVANTADLPASAARTAGVAEVPSTPTAATTETTARAMPPTVADADADEGCNIGATATTATTEAMLPPSIGAEADDEDQRQQQHGRDGRDGYRDSSPRVPTARKAPPRRWGSRRSASAPRYSSSTSHSH